MDNETNTEYKPKYYVKFDTNTGKILSMSMSPIEEDDLDHIVVVETENQIVHECLKGNISKRKIGPIFDVENNTWEIGEKSNVLVLRELSKRIMQVTNKWNPNSDISIKVYKQDNEIEIEANYQTIKKNMNLADIADISKSDDSGLLNLYFTRKSDPDYLIDSIQVDPVILLRNKKLKYQLSDQVSKHTDIENISIFTRPIFHSYSLQVLDKLIKSDYYLNRQQVLQVAGNAQDCHVAIIKQGDTLKLQSFVTEVDHTAPLNVQTRFIVCDGHIDAPAGVFEVDRDDLYSGKTFYAQVDFEWPSKPLIVYRSKGLVVKYLGDTYG